MARMINLSLCLTDIDKSLIQEAKNGKKYVNLTVSVNDQSNDWGKDVSVWNEQTKEQREAKQSKVYCGSGKTFWTSEGGVVSQGTPSAPAVSDVEDDGLPF